MTLNDLLRGKGFDPAQVGVMRHRPREPKLNRVMPWLAAERPDVFNAYQQTQNEKIERALQTVKYVASFLGRSPGRATFVGLYAVNKWTPMLTADLLSLPPVADIVARGMTVGAKRSVYLWFDLSPVADFYPEWKGRLIINWPPPDRSWWRRAQNKQNNEAMTVLAIREESAFDASLPPWDHLVLSWDELAIMPSKLRAAMNEWRGIYLIFDTASGKGYVGSASGADNLLGRWQGTNSFAPRPAPRPVSAGDTKTAFVAARFVLDVAEGRRPLPLVTETLPLAEEVRRQLGWEYGRVVRSRNKSTEFTKDDPRLFSPIFHGKDEYGTPARSHDHAFYLPSDEDRDGRIDHVTVYAAGRFSRDDVAALDRLRTLSFGKDAEAEVDANGTRSRRPTHRLLLTGLLNQREASRISAPAAVWVSATPYIAFRHLKRRGQKRDHRNFIPPEAMPEFMVHVLGEDLNQRGDLAHLPKPVVEYLPDPLSALDWRYRSLQFRRVRNRPGDDGYSRPFGAFRLTFPQPVSGPICLGYACHFGMGNFRPVASA